jgi:hypothetical protein
VPGGGFKIGSSIMLLFEHNSNAISQRPYNKNILE